jgi:hypothetical protein
MHLCYELISLIPLPLLPPLATTIVIVVIVVIVVIIHLVIITSPALTFHARWNPATPSSQSQQQIVSIGGGGWWRHDRYTEIWFYPRTVIKIEQPNRPVFCYFFCYNRYHHDRVVIFYGIHDCRGVASASTAWHRLLNNQSLMSVTFAKKSVRKRGPSQKGLIS